MAHNQTLELSNSLWTENRLWRGAYALVNGLANALARFLVRRGHFQGLRSNLAVIYGLPKDSPVLEKRVIENLRNAFVCYVDFFIIALRGPEAIEAACDLDPASLGLIKEHVAQGRGIVLVAAHSSSLDVFMLAMSRHFPEIQALTLAQPPLNTRIMNRLRGKYGMKLTPITSASLRTAVRRLRNGGIVGIAADVPTPYGAPLSLFGRPCRLPIGHTRLATATDSAIVVGISQRVGPGEYQGFGIEVGRKDGGEEDWAASILEVLEHYIVARPQEWFMPPPLWPAPVKAPLLFQHRLPPALTSRLIRG
ncbi:MAG: lysophospholipid acyltransferase family protein [Anaerolineales bacterium]